MKRYKLTGIFASVLLMFSIFTLLSISEVNAEEVISVNAEWLSKYNNHWI